MAGENAELETGGSQFTEAAELAKALQELQTGERTATEMEKKLDAMEAKIEALLAQAEQEQQSVERIKPQESQSAQVVEKE